ncbi:TonB-dependent receptor domain-containing protein [Leptospira interrogans]
MLGSAAMYLALGALGSVCSSVFAQGVSSQTVSFNIPAQSLGSALTSFADRAGVKLLFPSTMVAGKSSAGLSGSLTRQQALSRLLAGTGLTYRFTSADTVTISGPNAAESSGSATVDGAIALDTIDVSGGTGAAAANLPYQTPGSSAYISAEQIQLIPPTSTGDIFKTTPGVTVAGNRNGVSMNVNIRGLQGMNRVATMIDGAIQQSSSYRGYSGHDSRVYVDPEFIAGIEIEKGPGSSPGAMGGSVNMRTLSTADILEEGKNYGARIRGGLGSNTVAPDAARSVSGMAGRAGQPSPPLVIGLTDSPDMPRLDNGFGSAVAAMTTGNIDVLAGYSYRRAGNYFAGTHGKDKVPGGTTIRDRFSPYGYGEEVHNTSQDTRSTLAKVKLRPADGHSLEIGYVRYESLYGEAYPDLMLYLGTTGLYIKNQGKLNEVVSDTYTARYAFTPVDNPWVDLRANVWLSEVSNDWNSYSLGTDVMTWGADAHNTSRVALPIGNFKVNYGLQYYIEDVQSESLTTGGASNGNMNGERSMSSVFARAEYTVLDKIRFDAGIRYDTFRTGIGDYDNPAGVTDKTGSKANPNFGITLMPLDGLQIFGTYAQGWRPPSVRETTLRMSGFINANPDLKPEESENWEFGANYLKNGILTDSDKLRVKVAYFDNDYKDYIVRANIGGFPRGFRNIPGVKMKGIEFSGAYDIGWGFAEFGINRYTKVEYCLTVTCENETSGDDYGSYHIPPKYSGSITLGVRLLDEKLTIGGRLTYAGDRAIGRSGVGAVNSDWAPYAIYDAFGTYKFDDQTLIDLSAENITDLYYLDALSDARMPSPGRTVRVTMTKKF